MQLHRRVAARLLLFRGRSSKMQQQSLAAFISEQRLGEQQPISERAPCGSCSRRLGAAETREARTALVCQTLTGEPSNAY